MGQARKKKWLESRQVGYLTGPPYLGHGGCRAALYKLIPAKQKPVLTEVPLPAGDQKQPQFYALYGTEAWLKLLGSLCTSAGFFLKQTSWRQFWVKWENSPVLQGWETQILPPLTSFMIEITIWAIARHMRKMEWWGMMWEARICWIWVLTI